MDTETHNGRHRLLGGLFAPERDIRAMYQRHFCDRRKERQLLSTGSFFFTFAAVRAITHAIRAERGPFRNITPGGRHIHHMTFGITGLITVGYLWLLEIGIDERRRASRLTSLVYGAGAALTLDEFALWLNLEDDYWSKQGRESIDAVVLFGCVLAMSVIGRGFLAELLGHPPANAAADAPHSTNGHQPGAVPANGREPGAAAR
ncbi:MAG TPA: hypothetical protein VKG82_08980 [Solirubrobacteraceae bacterium]|nr:hypothetical protein [Solirubrobacteraceae bacterium]